MRWSLLGNHERSLACRVRRRYEPARQIAVCEIEIVRSKERCGEQKN
jgi:hypothetical protein